MKVKVQLLERLSEGRRMPSSCHLLRHSSIPPSPPFFLRFEIAHLLALIPSFTRSLLLSSHFPSTLTVSPSSLSLSLSHSFSSFFPPCHLPPLLYPAFLLTSLPISPFLLFFLSLLSPPLPPFMKCGWWLAGSCWLASGGGYSFIIPPRLPDCLATMSQELNICHYYLLVLFDLEAAQ